MSEFGAVSSSHTIYALCRTRRQATLDSDDRILAASSAEWPSSLDPKRLQPNAGCSAFSPTSELMVILRPSARVARSLAARATLL